MSVISKRCCNVSFPLTSKNFSKGRSRSKHYYNSLPTCTEICSLLPKYEQKFHEDLHKWITDPSSFSRTSWFIYIWALKLFTMTTTPLVAIWWFMCDKFMLDEIILIMSALAQILIFPVRSFACAAAYRFDGSSHCEDSKLKTFYSIKF